jgi:hypothetical protein
MPPIVKEEEPVEEIQMIMAPGRNPVMAKQKRKPLVAQFPQAPLVQAPIVERQANNKKQKRKPRVGAVPSLVEAKAEAPQKRRPQVGKIMDASQLASRQVSVIPEAAIKRSVKRPSVGVM